MKQLRIVTFLAPMACGLLLPPQRATGQGNPVPIQVSPTDESAPYDRSSFGVHARGPARSQTHPTWSHPSGPSAISVAAMPSIAVVPPPGFYPADVSSPTNGPTVLTAESHPLYVDCPDSCWGSPATFLSNLDQSTFIHVVDQYVGSATNNRYTLGKAGSVDYPKKTLYDADILAIVHAGGKAFGTGYNHIYHVFLPRGVDACLTGTNQCYSPDNPATFFFCAYHASVTFTDIGHTLFTVEPYQDVLGCSVAPGSPNGALVDSTADVLSHELFETISDPDGTAWYQDSSVLFGGAEIGDICQAAVVIGADVYFSYGVVTLHGHSYEVQPEYSNAYHACAYVPQ